jgi:hypothetical protein
MADVATVPRSARRTFWRPALTTGLAAAVVTGVWLAAPPMGTDLSAQVARADFFAAYGWAPLDFRWYGGVSPHGYSLVSPPLMAWLGPRPTGALAAVVSSVAFVLLLLRTGAPRPLLGGVLGAACFVGNLVSGRVTFALGVAIGLLALLVLTDARVRALPAAGLLAALASATSPVAGLFVGLAGVALFISDVSGPNALRWLRGAVLVAGAALPLAVMAGLFGTGGPMNMTGSDALHAAVASLAVAGLVPRRAIRIGALLSAAGVVSAFALTTPVGLNATRLATMYALPVVAAYARLPFRGIRPTAVWLAPVLVLLAWWQPPVLDRDLTNAGDPAASPAYFAPLNAELARQNPAGRIEVVPTEHYWESAYLEAPLARGWLRQADLRWNPLFFDGTLDAESYHEWLVDNGVSNVALANVEVSWIGAREAGLIRQGLPYLTPVWSNQDWTLYEVASEPGIVAGPASLVEAAPDRVVVAVTRPGEVSLRVRWSRWLRVDGPACLAPAGDWTTLRTPEPGSYTISGSLTASGPRC